MRSVIALACACVFAGSAWSATSAPTVQQRTAAAKAVASTNPLCTSLTPFYWEIGDKTGKLASGTGGNGAKAAPTAVTPMPVASASKWLFATYVVEKQKGLLSSQDLKFMNFTSGYTNLSDCSAKATVGSCLGEPGRVGGSNGDWQPWTDGRFFYNGGHMQMQAYAGGLGPQTTAPLAGTVRAIDGTDLTTLAYVQPQLAGGASMTPAQYAQFLRNLLSGRYHYMPGLLGAHAVCTHTNSADCPAALFSPVNQSKPGLVNDVSDERWHYSLGHWVEDDPQVGDGAFSSAGHLGFYPWIDQGKAWYGVLARVDTANVDNPDPHKVPGRASMQCGRLMRAAWLNPPR